MAILHFDDQSFHQGIQASPLVLVDFWAPWCGPCRMMSPVIDQADQELEGQVVIAKLNVDDAPKVSQEMGILSIPTLVLFKDGKEVDRAVGLCNRADIDFMVNRYL